MTVGAAYRVEVRGRVSDAMLGPYADEFVVARTPATTALTGAVRDAAHLNGIVTHLTSLGLDLVSVTELAAPSVPIVPRTRPPRSALR